MADDSDFRGGFTAGYRAIKGTAVGMPGFPGQPGTPGNLTPFLVGIREGLKAAGVDLPRF